MRRDIKCDHRSCTENDGAGTCYARVLILEKKLVKNSMGFAEWVLKCKNLPEPTMEKFMDPEVVFARELDKFYDKRYRDLTVKMLMRVPNTFWYAASSRTGKNHPQDEYGLAGKVLHTKRAFFVLLQLMDAEVNKHFGREDADQCMMAMLIHDTMVGSKAHAPAVLPYFMKRTSQFTDEERALMERPLKIAQRHMGRWGGAYRPKPGDAHQYLVHIADFLASRRQPGHLILGDGDTDELDYTIRFPDEEQRGG